MQYKTYRTGLLKQIHLLMSACEGKPAFETFKVLSEINRLADVIKIIDAMPPLELNKHIEATTEVFESIMNQPLIIKYDAV